MCAYAYSTSAVSAYIAAALDTHPLKYRVGWFPQGKQQWARSNTEGYFTYKSPKPNLPRFNGSPNAWMASHICGAMDRLVDVNPVEVEDLDEVIFTEGPALAWAIVIPLYTGMTCTEHLFEEMFLHFLKKCNPTDLEVQYIQLLQNLKGNNFFNSTDAKTVCDNLNIENTGKYDLLIKALWDMQENCTSVKYFAKFPESVKSVLLSGNMEESTFVMLFWFMFRVSLASKNEYYPVLPKEMLPEVLGAVYPSENLFTLFTTTVAISERGAASTEVPILVPASLLTNNPASGKISEQLSYLLN